jgi:hypothetical protein
MSDEGAIINDTRALMKSEMLNQLHRMGPSTPENWQKAVFELLTQHNLDDVDGDVEGSQAGPDTWFRAFDALTEELIEDGYAQAGVVGKQRIITPTLSDGALDVSQLVDPSR